MNDENDLDHKMGGNTVEGAVECAGKDKGNNS